MGAKMYVLKRSLQAIPIMIIVLTINFLLVHLAPGSPIDYLIPRPTTPEEREAYEVKRAEMEKKFGLDKSLYEQYFLYIKNALHGDFGYSYIYQDKPAMDLIGERVVNTLELTLPALIIGTLIAIPLGVYCSTRAYTKRDSGVIVSGLVFYSMPAYVIAIILQYFLAVKFDLFPVQGVHDLRKEYTGFAAWLDKFHHIILPMITLTLFSYAFILLLVRNNMLEILEQDFITTARAKGLPEHVVVYKHALRNAVLPVVTVIGLGAGGLLAGALLTEIVYSWPGMGLLFYEALVGKDYPVLLALFAILSLVTIIANIITEVVYSLVDPRIKLS